MGPIDHLRSLALAIVLAVSAVACDGNNAQAPGDNRTPVASPTSDSGRVIGLVGTLSGPGSIRGNEAFEGADVGIASLNRSLDGDELPFELVTLDDEGDPARATELIAELAASDRTVGIVYAGPPQGLPPANVLLSEAGIPAVMVFGDLYSARLLRSHLFQVAPPFLWQARRIAAYLARDRDYALVGVIAQKSLTGNTAVDSLRSALDQEGDIRLAVARFESEDQIAGALGELQDRRVEAIVVQASPHGFGAVLEDLALRGATYKNTRTARTASLPALQRKNKSRRGVWRPQVVGFDEAISTAIDADLPVGTVAADSYSRGVDYLPVESFEDFRRRFRDWWDMEPRGWEVRAYDAVRMIGWAARRADPGADLALVLERMKDERFGGLEVTFGPDDHVGPSMIRIGLWVVPGPHVGVREERPDALPWVPLQRGFSTDGRRTDVAPQDWAVLFRDPPPPNAPAPRFRDARFGVTTGRSDPIH